jgi:geranylgeranyl reductase family protein
MIAASLCHLSVADFDVIVVGGGPAGSAAAFTAAGAGLSVCLIDKADFPRDKLCGGLLSERSRKVFHQVFSETWPDALVKTSDKISFQMGGHRLALVEGHSDLHFTMRRSFDAHLLGLARAAGAQLRTGAAPEAIDFAARAVRLGDGRTLTYRNLIGADGVNSQVARLLFGRAFDPETIAFGLEVEVPRADLADHDDTAEIDFAAAVAGYGWVFPKITTFTIGVGGIHVLNPDMRTALAVYLKRLGLDIARYKVKGQYIPFGDYRTVPGQGRVLLCGDAAGLVDPITGEGIAYAMQSGQIAARAIVAAKARGRAGSTLWEYQQALTPITRAIRQANRWRGLIFADWARRPFTRLFPKARVMQHGYLDVLAGNKDYDAVPWLLASQVVQSLLKVLWRPPTYP